MSKKKILHISKYYYPFSGGIEQTARDCVCALSEGYVQKVIAFNNKKQDELSIVDGVEVVRCGCFAKISSQPISATYYNKLKHILREFKPDIVIFHYPNPFVAAILLRELRHLKDIKLVLYWHLDIVKQKFLRRFFEPQNRCLLRRACKVIATSQNYVEGSQWLRTVKEKCVVVPSCINEERMRITPQVQTHSKQIRKDNVEKIICVSVGRHTEYKGFHYLIEATKFLDDTFQFYLIGTGELTDELKNEAKGDDRICFLGKVSDEVLKSYLLAADILCFPSITRNEAFGLALAEGMYFGKPAVTFTIPGSGVNFVNLANETGIECNNRDAKAYAMALIQLSDNSDLREKYGKAAKKHVEENFLFSDFKNNMNKLINNILQEK